MHCVIFDFDNTLTTFNVSMAVNELNGNENVFTDIVCSLDFKKWLQFLKNKHIKLYVMSFGYNNVITNYLKKYDLYNYFDKIYTPSSYGLKDGFSYSKIAKGKNRFIERICSGILNDNILLIDDDRTNIAWAKEAGYKVILVDPRTGFGSNDFVYACSIVSNWLKK